MRGDERFFATMCNPPFFERLAEAGRNPSTDFRGTAAEMCCPGGEAAFVRHMLQDSLELKVPETLLQFLDSLSCASFPHTHLFARMHRTSNSTNLQGWSLCNDAVLVWWDTCWCTASALTICTGVGAMGQNGKVKYFM